MTDHLRVDDKASLLGYEFENPSLAIQARTHRSAGGAHNERLEFLGDAILGVLIAEFLFEQFAQADEGQLTRTRASLVNRETLAALAREHALGELLILGEGEMKSGGWRRDSILANAIEAVIGAVYLDSDYVRCRQFVRQLFASRLKDIDPESAAKDNKTALQEYLQRRRLQLPDYSTSKVSGPSHRQVFTVCCEIPELAIKAEATGSSRRKAEQAAARLTLEQLKASPQ